MMTNDQWTYQNFHIPKELIDNLGSPGPVDDSTYPGIMAERSPKTIRLYEHFLPSNPGDVVRDTWSAPLILKLISMVQPHDHPHFKSVPDPLSQSGIRIIRGPTCWGIDCEGYLYELQTPKVSEEYEYCGKDIKSRLWNGVPYMGDCVFIEGFIKLDPNITKYTSMHDLIIYKSFGTPI